MGNRRFSVLEGTSVVVGAGVGAGIMAVPYLAASVGLVGLAIILPLAWAASTLVHLMLAETLFRTGRDLQIVELMRLYVFRGRLGRPLLWLVFALLSVAFLANLAAYVAGAGEVVADLAGIDARAAEAIVYVAAAGVVFFGLPAVGVAERFGALVLAVLVAVLAIGAVGVPFQPAVGPAGSASDWLALYGLVMYAYWTFYSVPQVVAGMGDDHRGAVRAIMLGLGVNGVLTAVVAVVALGVSAEVTEVAMVGIAASLGDWTGIVGSLFIVAAFVTSYWSVSLALADILRERTSISRRTAWLLATLPSLLVLWLGVWAFLEWLGLAAAATAMVVALITIPMYRTSRHLGAVAHPDWSLGAWGSPPMLALAFLAMLFMAIGSVLAI